jgi:geranylgeranyl diphosphate synthase type 3
MHASDISVLEPYKYISNIPGKDIRGSFIDAFQQWLQIPGNIDI